MIIRHLHLPSLTRYATASAIQERLVASLLAHKKRAPAAAAAAAASPLPAPTIITAQFHPVYTCGRREVGAVSATQRAYLTGAVVDGTRAEFHEAARGGQTTFHGPGQMVAYPVLDLKGHGGSISSSGSGYGRSDGRGGGGGGGGGEGGQGEAGQGRPGLTVRHYVALLEEALRRTCARYGVPTVRSACHPGLWVDEDSKIASLGVHLRRNVTSHGVALNVSTHLPWFDRIVACGLEGKRATSLRDQGVTGTIGVEAVARAFVEEFAAGLGGVEAVREITVEDLD